jgi:hypothetical protein
MFLCSSISVDFISVWYCQYFLTAFLFQYTLHSHPQCFPLINLYSYCYSFHFTWTLVFCTVCKNFVLLIYEYACIKEYVLFSMSLLFKNFLNLHILVLFHTKFICN